MSSVVEFLIERLENLDLKHVFCLPGEFILNFLSKLSNSKKIETINTVDESNAGFMADGYARSYGIGCVAVTYNVGVLKLCNSIMGAYNEHSPIIVIAGSPGLDERDNFSNYEIQYEIFKNLVCDYTILDNPSTAGYAIDKCLQSLKYYKKPVYIELPKDIAEKTIFYDVYTQGTPKAPVTDSKNLEDALVEVTNCLKSSERPVLLVGVEISRCQLGRELIKFAERNNIPMVCSLLSKSLIDERHPLYAGIYVGLNSQPFVKDLVEKSDCLLVCGEIVGEATFGYRSTKAYTKWQMITCTINNLKVRNHHYPEVKFIDFCKSLFKIDLAREKYIDIPKKYIVEFIAEKNKLTISRLFEKINSVLTNMNFIVADVGNALSGASELTTIQHHTFYASANYLSMGFAIPAAIGINFAKPELRPIIITGDGSFQMSCVELSTAIRWKQKPIVFVLNNKGYTTERIISEGKYNNIANWNYENIHLLLGDGIGFQVSTEEELEEAMNLAFKSNKLCVINCNIDSKDTSSALKRFVENKKTRSI